MAGRNGNKNFEQFSKKLSKWVLIFWAIYRIMTVAVAIIRPDVADHLYRLVTGVDDAAMCVVISYTANSATEKISIQYFNAKAKIAGADNDEDKENEDEEKGGSNG